LSVRLFHRIQRWALQQADATVRFNRISCDALNAFYGSKLARRYEINPIGVTVPERSARHGNEPVVRLLSVGRLTESKNVEFAVRVLAPLRHLSWRFDIVGQGERLESARTLARTLGLADKVFCHGRQPETEPWFLNADLFLFTSRLDNSPLAVLEAMSYGVPVLGIRPDGKNYRSGIEELVEHGQTGILAGEEDDFARQLETVLQQPQSLAPLGKAARAQVLAHHTWEAHLDRYERLFESLFATRATTPSG
jgi:glycosyltransferase involved in cell wall biosynthesis